MPIFTVMVRGSGSSGKSALIKAFTDPNFSSQDDGSNPRAIMGAEFVTTNLQVEGHSNPQKMTIWDMSTDPRYEALLPMYEKNLDTCVFCFNATDNASFEEAIRNYLTFSKKNPNVPCILVATRTHLINASNQDGAKAILEKAKKFAKDNKINYVETSVKNKKGIAYTGTKENTLSNILSKNMKEQVAKKSTKQASENNTNTKRCEKIATDYRNFQGKHGKFGLSFSVCFFKKRFYFGTHGAQVLNAAAHRDFDGVLRLINKRVASHNPTQKKEGASVKLVNHYLKSTNPETLLLGRSFIKPRSR